MGGKGKLILEPFFWCIHIEFKGYFNISDKIEFVYPTNDERIEFEESGVKEATQGSGDSKAQLNMKYLDAANSLDTKSSDLFYFSVRKA